MLGGSISFDMDTSLAHTGINTGLYLVFPDPSVFPAYCDAQGFTARRNCMEMDIIENNGNCLGQTTWHVWPGNQGGCDQNGCYGQKYRSGKTNFKAAFTTTGFMTVYMDGVEVDVIHPKPARKAVEAAVDKMAKVGGRIISSQWEGWAPWGNCGPHGSLSNSSYSIENLVVMGTIKQGPEASRCAKNLLV